MNDRNFLNILFISQEDPFFIIHFFKEFERIKTGSNINVQGVIIQTTLGKKSKWLLYKQMYEFYGLRDFVILGTKYSFKKFLNLFAVKIFKGNFWGAYSLEHFFLKHKWNLISIKDINSKESLETLKKFNLDLIVSVAASQIFKKGILELPKYGCINVHNAKLPQNRGMMPCFWALLNYDKEPYSAMTIHRMNEKLDDGEIILQEEFKLDPNESLYKLLIRTKKLSAHLLMKTLEVYINGEPDYQPNDASLSTYHSFPTSDDVKKFKAKGLKLL